ncbi:MAG: polyphosphate polymerase domain-containing protein [Bacteroidia bacterium]
MSPVDDILGKFEGIGLREMDKVKLMDRTDTKYTFSLKQLSEILEEAQPFYRVLEVEGKRISRYKTLYYDTANFSLYTRHHNGELNRYKIRHRTYVESHIGFLEVKFKNNKGRTIKDRIKKAEAPADWEGETGLFLQSKLPFDVNSLVPVLWVNYSRLTLVNKESAERLTIDLDLEFIKDGKTKNFNKLVIAEVKQEKRKASPFTLLMKKHHIREGSISKYCMGVVATQHEVKKNNFKEKLRTLKHIVDYDYIITVR